MSVSKKYYWLKLKDGFFTDPKIKKLRRIAGGDTYTIILQKIMLLSIQDGGVIEFQGIEKTLHEELALILDEEVNNVEVALSFMRSIGLIEALDDTNFLLPNVPELIGSESDSKERVRRFREKHKQLTSVTCNADVTPCNKNVTTEIRDKREEIELDKDNTCDALVTDIIKETPFDLFWKHYPNKVGKDAARKAWDKKKNKPSIDKIIQAVEMYKLSKTVRDGFIANPATWINQGRWDDEVTLSDYDKAKAVQSHTGMSPSETLDMQLAKAQMEWESNQ